MIEAARYWIEKLNLVKHPEGGYYVRTYFAREWIEKHDLPPRFGGSRPFSTAITYLLPGDDFSAFHRIQSDEMWHFYAGSALTLHILERGGRMCQKVLGPDIEQGESFQQVVEAGCWFAAAVRDSTSYSLVGCTVAPGFNQEDFELADREILTAQYPQHSGLIGKFTRLR
jgi:predicted cupin superfamily sugar epimerase